METLWVFPGQGGQYGGMLKKVDPNLKQHVENLLGLSLLDTDDGYADSVQLQVSITLLQVDQVDALLSAGFKPRLVAGHSLGVFAAAYAAECIERDDVFRLVKYRAEQMQNAYPTGYGMGVIVGLTRNEVEKIVKEVNDDENPVFASNQNSEEQTAISGKVSAINTVLSLALDKGAAKALLLKVPVPSHSPLMTNVADKMMQMLSSVNVQKPHSVIYLANDTGKAVRQVAPLTRDLADNIAHPVFFETMMAVATNYQPDTIINFAPGQPFKTVLAQKFEEVNQVHLNQMTIEDAIYLLRKWKRGLEK
jgi:malonate decarboxylase epsilon subunit